MAETYIVALELLSRVDVEVEADNEEDAIQKAFTHFDLNFECYSTTIRLGEWDAEIVQGPEDVA